MPTTTEILDRTRETLRIAELGAQDVARPDPSRRLAGLLNVAVFGRAVTNVLQNLRTQASGFEEWYAPKVEEMRADPLLRYFYGLRTSSLKSADRIPAVSNTFIEEMELPRDIRKFGPPPPGAVSFFVGDHVGGAGWMVRMPDGSEQPFYVALPPGIGSSEMVLLGAPTSHLGSAIPNPTAAKLCRLYVEYLSRLATEASAAFGSP
jgi:hypothetical protein